MFCSCFGDFLNEGRVPTNSIIKAILMKMWKVLSEWFPANIYLFEVNNRNTRERCEICPKLEI